MPARSPVFDPAKPVKGAKPKRTTQSVVPTKRARKTKRAVSTKAVPTKAVRKTKRVLPTKPVSKTKTKLVVAAKSVSKTQTKPVVAAKSVSKTKAKPVAPTKPVPKPKKKPVTPGEAESKASPDRRADERHKDKGVRCGSEIASKNERRKTDACCGAGPALPSESPAKA